MTGLSGGVCTEELEASWLSEPGCTSVRRVWFLVRLKTLEYRGGAKSVGGTASVWAVLKFSTNAASSEEYRGGARSTSLLLPLRRREAIGCRWLCWDLSDIMMTESIMLYPKEDDETDGWKRGNEESETGVYTTRQDI